MSNGSCEEQHPLFEELEAFDPLWHMNYHSLREAVADADVGYCRILPLYADYLETEEGQKYLRDVASVRDYKREAEALRKAEEESALPFKLSNIGKVPNGPS